MCDSRKFHTTYNNNALFVKLTHKIFFFLIYLLLLCNAHSLLLFRRKIFVFRRGKVNYKNYPNILSLAVSKSEGFYGNLLRLQNH